MALMTNCNCSVYKEGSWPKDICAYHAGVKEKMEIWRLRRLEDAVRALRDGQARRINPAWQAIDEILDGGGAK